MSRLFFEVSARVKLVMLLMVVLPCVPGLTFLLAGWACEPRRPAQEMTPARWTQYHRSAQQARGLYKAGSIVLVVGLLGGTVVVWQVIRQREEEEERNETS